MKTFLGILALNPEEVYIEVKKLKQYMKEIQEDILKQVIIW